MGQGGQMEWFEAVDGYCERVDAAFGRTRNAVTNAAFLIAAFGRGGVCAGKRVLTVILALIGIGSFCFHICANLGGFGRCFTDLMFILVYIYVATRDYFGASRGVSWVAVIGFFPFAAVIGWLISDWENFGSTRGYVPVPILILIYAYLLRRKLPDVALGLTIGLGILVASMGARWADEPLCHMHPMGTHFLWHILNAVMLAWMIEVYRRHMLAGRRAKR